jgi:hypothetical protein
MLNSANLFTFDGNQSEMSEWIVRLIHIIDIIENNFMFEKLQMK